MLDVLVKTPLEGAIVRKSFPRDHVIPAVVFRNLYRIHAQDLEGAFAVAAGDGHVHMLQRILPLLAHGIGTAAQGIAFALDAIYFRGGR